MWNTRKGRKSNYEKASSRRQQPGRRTAFCRTGGISGGSAPAGAPPPSAPYCHHSGGADTGHPVCHRRGGGIHRPGKGSGGYGAHRPVPGGGLAAADRPWRADGRAAHVRQLCGHGRGCLRGVQLRRYPPCQHPERLRPPGAGCGQDPLCAVQPLRQRAAGGKPHPEPVQQNAGKQHLSVRHVGYRHAGGGHRFRRQHRPADRVHLHHERTAALGYDRYAGHPGADGLCRRQPPSGGGGGHLQRWTVTGKPLCAQPCAGRPGAAEQRGQRAPVAGLAEQRHRAGCV